MLFLFKYAFHLINYFLVPVSLIDGRKAKVGIGFYHPNQKEEVFMNELRACLSKELSFKQITQAMMTPPLVIDTFYEKSSYAEWNIALTSVFLGLVLVGVLIELYKHVKIKKQKASETISGDEKHQIMLQST